MDLVVSRGQGSVDIAFKKHTAIRWIKKKSRGRSPEIRKQASTLRPLAMEFHSDPSDIYFLLLGSLKLKMKCELTMADVITGHR